ncbi:hypothetical protein ACFVYV_47035 [Streptomyces mirabilis]|uniref:hypothetical protein n=1 Tax=Streptomyces mirabilis TaxID=68239 RepID=UPI0036D9BA7A
MEEQEQGDADADEEAGQGVEDQHFEHRRERGEEVGPRGDAVGLASRRVKTR